MLKAVLAQNTPGQCSQQIETVSKRLLQCGLLANQAIGTSLSAVVVTAPCQVEPPETTLGGEQRVARTIDHGRGAPHSGGFLRSYGGPSQPISETWPIFELAYAKHLLAHERVTTARTVLERAIKQYPQDERLKALYRAIAPGRVKRCAIQYRNRKAEAAWIRAHRSEYHGKWVALFGDEVLGIGDDLQTVLQLVRQFRLDEPPTTPSFRRLTRSCSP